MTSVRSAATHVKWKRLERMKVCGLTGVPFTDLASQEKKRLEDKQRAARKAMSKSGEEWTTR